MIVALADRHLVKTGMRECMLQARLHLLVMRKFVWTVPVRAHENHPIIKRWVYFYLLQFCKISMGMGFLLSRHNFSIFSTVHLCLDRYLPALRRIDWEGHWLNIWLTQQQLSIPCQLLRTQKFHDS